MKHQEALDEDSRRRLQTNPLRILDSKNPGMQELIERAPRLLAHLDEESRLHFERLTGLLNAAGVEYVVNPRLVRGLDYYSKTVFEWVTDRLGAQGTVCAGGRYDGLVEQLGGRPTGAVGFAVGLERLAALMEGSVIPASEPHVFLVPAGEVAEQAAFLLAERLRDELPALRAQLACGGGSLKSQMKRADRSGARLALVLGEQELETGSVAVKFLREEREQQSVAQAELADFVRTLLW